MGLLDFAGTAINGVLGYLGAKDTNQANVEMSRENRDWMANMSNTSYQRAVTDMKLAGLNPMLAYSQGGANTPTSAAPVMQNKLGAAVSSAQQGSQTQAAIQQIEQSRAQTELIRAEADKVRSETLEQTLNSAYKTAQLRSLAAGADLTDTQRVTELAKQPGTQAESWRSVYALAAEQPNSAHHYRTGPNNGEGITIQPRDAKGSVYQANADRARAQAQSAQYQLSEDKARSEFWKTDFGMANPFLKGMLDVFRNIFTARQALK